MMSITYKKCTGCFLKKQLSDFHRRGSGYRSKCKVCRSDKTDEQREKDKERCSRWYYANRTLKPKRQKKTKKQIQRDYRQKNKEKLAKYNKGYIEKNKEWAVEYRRNYESRRYKEDINFKLRKRLRDRIKGAIKNNYKSGSAVKDLGCTVSELKRHLEKQFDSEMSWENYGLHGWHIDHIKSLASFDLTDRQQFLEACHYTNLQPLWAKENIAKGG